MNSPFRVVDPIRELRPIAIDQFQIAESFLFTRKRGNIHTNIYIEEWRANEGKFSPRPFAPDVWHHSDRLGNETEAPYVRQ